MLAARSGALRTQLALLLLIAGCSPIAPASLPFDGFAPDGGRAAPGGHAGAEICGNGSLLTGPSKPPKGAVVVPAGDNASLTPVAHTTYWFAGGTHTFGSNPYGQIVAAEGDDFIGGPGAVLDGRLKNQYAFTSAASNVMVEYLTIRRFGAVGSNNGQAVVNHNPGRKWLIQYNTVIDDAGAGVFLGPDSVTRFNCLSHNGEYGFASYARRGDFNVVLDHNEIVGNNTYNWEKHVYGCGCSGGGKFWDTNGGTVTNNWVHSNRGPALWADTDNNDFDFENNDVENNTGDGIIVEISYNTQIEKNTFVRNALVDGPTNPGFPTGAIYISESGGDSRVRARYDTISITDNTFVDNWSGVVLFENADRFCGSPANSKRRILHAGRSSGRELKELRSWKNPERAVLLRLPLEDAEPRRQRESLRVRPVAHQRLQSIGLMRLAGTLLELGHLPAMVAVQAGSYREGEYVSSKRRFLEQHVRRPLGVYGARSKPSADVHAVATRPVPAGPRQHLQPVCQRPIKAGAPQNVWRPDPSSHAFPVPPHGPYW
ncbi:MAG: right-handed parallel beta-helix repeat-containing protein [Candidatus Cybelea sp.]